MYNSIILFASLFGSYYLFRQSVLLINNTLLQEKKVPIELYTLNIFTFMLSGSVVFANYCILYKNIKL